MILNNAYHYSCGQVFFVFDKRETEVITRSFYRVTVTINSKAIGVEFNTSPDMNLRDKLLPFGTRTAERAIRFCVHIFAKTFNVIRMFVLSLTSFFNRDCFSNYKLAASYLNGVSVHLQYQALPWRFCTSQYMSNALNENGWGGGYPQTP